MAHYIKLLHYSTLSYYIVLYVLYSILYIMYDVIQYISEREWWLQEVRRHFPNGIDVFSKDSGFDNCFTNLFW